MRNLFRHFFAQYMIKGLLIGGSAVAAIFTYFWSKQDGHLNLWPFVYLAGLITAMLIGYWIQLKVQAWRTGKK